jgi:hypothetical protein
MSKRPNPREFKGELAKPIRGKRLKWSPAAEVLVGGLTKEQVAAANRIEQQRELAEAAKKLDLLFSHYDITPTGNPAADYWLLSLRLAMQIVPGFQVVGPRRRRPQVRTPAMLMRLLMDVDEVKLKLKLKLKPKRGGHVAEVADQDALTALTEQEGRWKGQHVPTLTTLLHQARDPNRNLLLRFYEYARSVGDQQLLRWLSDLAR